MRPIRYYLCYFCFIWLVIVEHLLFGIQDDASDFTKRQFRSSFIEASQGHLYFQFPLWFERICVLILIECLMLFTFDVC